MADRWTHRPAVSTGHEKLVIRRASDLVPRIAAKGTNIERSPAFQASAGSGIDADGSEVRYAATFFEDTKFDSRYAANVLIHETGRILGLPDLYFYEHERWRRQANGPMVEWKIVKGPCPGSKHGLSCADPTSKTIHLNKYDWNKKSVYYHEHGHAFDFELLTDQDRTAIAQHVGWKGRWFWGDWDPETHAAEPNQERFADMYARMLTHPREGIWLRRYLRAVVQRAKPA